MRQTYLIALKGNQKKAHRDVQRYFKENAFDVAAEMRPIADAFDDTHGRTVRRWVFVCEDPQSLEALEDWPKLTKVLAVETISSLMNPHGGGCSKVTCDICYFLTSARASPLVIAATIGPLRTLFTGFLMWAFARMIVASGIEMQLQT